MTADEIDDFVEELAEEADIGDSKLERWLIKKAINVFTDGMTKKERTEYDSQAARDAEDRRARAAIKEGHEQTIFEMRKQKETLAIQKLQTEIEQLKTGQITQFHPGSSEQVPQVLFGELPLPASAPNFECADNPDEFTQFLDYIGTKPTSILILGSKGQGKSALAHALLEYIHVRSGKPAIILGAPREKKGLFPNWIRIVDNWDDIADGSIVLVDEAGVLLFARNSASNINKGFAEINAISRQRGLTLIYTSQSSRSVDVNTIYAGETQLIYKKPDTLGVAFERPEIKKIGKEALEILTRGVTDKSKIKEHSVVYFFSEDGKFLMRNGLASYWSEGLSRLFSNVAHAAPREQEIKSLYSQGMTQTAIAEKLGITQGGVSKVLKMS